MVGAICFVSCYIRIFRDYKGPMGSCFLSEWLLENTFRRGQYDTVYETEESLLKGVDTCSICHHNVDTSLKCCTIGCQVTFHPICARDAGLYMNMKKIGNLWRHKAYCGYHNIEQGMVDSQQYGPAKAKIMKQIRVNVPVTCFFAEKCRPFAIMWTLLSSDLITRIINVQN